MLVVIVSDYAEVTGGAAKVAIASARGLAERGIRVLFVCALSPVSPRLDHPLIEVHCLGLQEVWSRRNRLGAAVAAIWNRQAARGLDQLLRQVDPARTVVHFHQWTKALSPSVIWATRNSGLPCLISMHDYFLACPNGNYFIFSHKQPCTYRPMSLACLCVDCDSRSYAHKSVRLVRQAALQRAAGHRQATNGLAVIHVSAFARSVAEPLLPRAWRHFVVPNPVDVAMRPRVRVGGNRDFVFVGRFTPEKQAGLFAEAARCARVPATFLGDGPEAQTIRAVYPDARILPWGDRQTVDRLLEGARALVFPSSWYETSGLVVAEALARGVPTIVSRVTAAQDLITDGVNGLLCPPDDLPALVSRLELLKPDDVAERMGRHAFEMYWKAPLSESAHIDRLLTAYDAVLDRVGSAAAKDHEP